MSFEVNENLGFRAFETGYLKICATDFDETLDVSSPPLSVELRGSERVLVGLVLIYGRW